MALLNYATKEIFFKVVYCGPALSGKTTNIECLHSMIEPMRRGTLLSLWTGTDQILYFDILPERKEKDKQFSIGFQLFTIPGRLRDEASWKTVLKGADAIVFVADSQRRMRDANVESLHRIYTSLLAEKVIPMDIPVILQFNKRDVNDILTTEELNTDLNKKGYPYFEAIALRGLSVKETFQTVAKYLARKAAMEHLRGEAMTQAGFSSTGKVRPVRSSEDEEAREGPSDAVRGERERITAGRTTGIPDAEERSFIFPPDRSLTLLELRMREAKRSTGLIRKLRLFNKARKKRIWIYSLILMTVLLALFVSYLLISGIL